MIFFENIKNYMNQKHHDNVLIHIGKCGGSTLRNAIKTSEKVSISGVVHVRKPYYFKKQKYYIVIRDPIERCISAFNWRYKLVVDDAIQKQRFKGEYEALIKYKDFNQLSELLYIDGVLNSDAVNDFEKIHHLKERISFYLEGFFEKCQPGDIKGVFFQDKLGGDIKNILGVSIEGAHVEKRNDSYSKMISERAESNLKRYLEKDYYYYQLLKEIKY